MRPTNPNWPVWYVAVDDVEVGDQILGWAWNLKAPNMAAAMRQAPALLERALKDNRVKGRSTVKRCRVRVYQR